MWTKRVSKGARFTDHISIIVILSVLCLPRQILLGETEEAGAEGSNAPSTEPDARAGRAAREWLQHDGRHWQLVAEGWEDPAVTDALEQTRGQCPVGMVEVRGRMKLDPSPILYAWARIERLQLEACKEWLQRRWPYRCLIYDREKWLSISRDLKTRPMHFCIDRFEYPNVQGQNPLISITWREAARICRKQGKRLCSEDEWTFACEGEEAQPYPYGYVRDAEKCVIDRKLPRYDARALRSSNDAVLRQELDRLWRGEPSGSRPECRSPFGVYDMTGNVDEWTRTVHKGERPSILKGGYWGPVMNRCRPSTRAHDETYQFYQQGFRCCADMKGPLAGDLPPAPGVCLQPEAAGESGR